MFLKVETGWQILLICCTAPEIPVSSRRKRVPFGCRIDAAVSTLPYRRCRIDAAVFHRWLAAIAAQFVVNGVRDAFLAPR
jgi:hypothetical protein